MLALRSDGLIYDTRAPHRRPPTYAYSLCIAFVRRDSTYLIIDAAGWNGAGKVSLWRPRHRSCSSTVVSRCRHGFVSADDLHFYHLFLLRHHRHLHHHIFINASLFTGSMRLPLPPERHTPITRSSSSCAFCFLLTGLIALPQLSRHTKQHARKSATQPMPSTLRPL